MANGDKTDPLARYTATGSRSSSIPANPYKASGQNAYWNGQRWVPFNDPSTLPTVAKTQQVMPKIPGLLGSIGQSGPAIAQSILSVPASLGSKEAAAELGTNVGNAISAVPGARDIVGSNVAKNIAYFLPEYAKTENLQQSVSDLYSGDIKGAARNFAPWLGWNLLNVSVGGPATKGATTGFKAGGVRGIIPGFTKAVAGYTKPQALWAGLNVVGNVLQGMDLFGGGPVARAEAKTQETRPTSTSMLSADRYEELKRREQAQQSMDYLRTPQYVSTPYGASIKQTFTDAEGRVHTWNPRSNMYEVTGTVAAGTADAGMNLGLTAAQQLEFENRLRDIEEETRAVLSGLGGQTSAARAEAQEGREASRRRVAGSSQDIASGLAFLGMDTSPGVADVAQEYQARAGAEREAAIAKSLAQTISDISSRRAAALRAQEREKRELAAARLQLEQENILKKQEEEFLKTILGGGK